MILVFSYIAYMRYSWVYVKSCTTVTSVCNWFYFMFWIFQSSTVKYGWFVCKKKFKKYTHKNAYRSLDLVVNFLYSALSIVVFHISEKNSLPSFPKLTALFSSHYRLFYFQESWSDAYKDKWCEKNNSQAFLHKCYNYFLLKSSAMQCIFGLMGSVQEKTEKKNRLTFEVLLRIPFCL